MFVTFEGIEGCGKSTQVSLMGDLLRAKGLPFVITREPGGTQIGEKIRQILLSVQNSEMKPVTELFLYMASRAQHVEEVINPALAEKKTVLCDRFSDATIAYQVAARGVDIQIVQELNRIAASGLVPKLTFLLDCPVDIGLSRVKKRVSEGTVQVGEDRFEREQKSFHQKVREGYLQIAKKEERRVIVLDGTQDQGALHEEISSILVPKIMKERVKSVL